MAPAQQGMWPSAAGSHRVRQVRDQVRHFLPELQLFSLEWVDNRNLHLAHKAQL